LTGENTIRNMRLDNLHRIIHRQFLVSATAGLKGKKFRFTPAGIHRVTDINGIKPLDLADVTPNVYIEESKYESQIDKTNGNFDVGRGEKGGDRETATAASIRSNSANLRIDLKVQYAQRTLADTYRDMYRLERQFGDKNRAIYVQGQNGQNLYFELNELFADEYEFSYSLGGYMGNRMIDRQQFVQTLGVMLGNEQIMAEYDMRQIARIIAEQFPTIAPARKILKRPPAAREGFNRDAFDENQRILLGDDVQALVGDEHGDHITIHTGAMDMRRMPSDAQKRFDKHIQQHQVFLEQDQRFLGQIGGAVSQGQDPLNQAPTNEIAATANQATSLGGITNAALR